MTISWRCLSRPRRQNCGVTGDVRRDSRDEVSDRRWISSGSVYEAPIGYSRAVIDGDWIFVSGTTGIDPLTKAIAPDVETQCAQALEIIAGALAEANASFDDLVRVRYILPDAADFEPCWPQLRAAFGKASPAATMFVAGLIDPAFKIEIEVTARRAAPDKI